MSSILTHTLLYGFFHTSLTGLAFTHQNSQQFFLLFCYNWCFSTLLKAWEPFALFITLFAKSIVSGTSFWSLSQSRKDWYNMILSVVIYLRCRTKSLDMFLESCTISSSRSYKQDLQVIHLRKFRNFMNQHHQGQESHCLCQIVISWTFSTEEWWSNSLLFMLNFVLFCWQRKELHIITQESKNIDINEWVLMYLRTGRLFELKQF